MIDTSTVGGDRLTVTKLFAVMPQTSAVLVQCGQHRDPGREARCRFAERRGTDALHLSLTVQGVGRVTQWL